MAKSKSVEKPEDRIGSIRDIREQEAHVRTIEDRVDELREQNKHQRAALASANAELRRLIRGEKPLPFAEELDEGEGAP